MPMGQQCLSIAVDLGRTYNKKGFIRNLGRGQKGEEIMEVSAKIWHSLRFLLKTKPPYGGLRVSAALSRVLHKEIRISSSTRDSQPNKKSSKRRIRYERGEIRTLNQRLKRPLLCR